MSKFPPFEELSPEERREVGNMFADLARAVQFRDDPLRQRYYGGDGQKSIDLDISRLEASLYAFYSERVVPEDFTKEVEIESLWGKVQLFKDIANHHDIFYFEYLKRVLNEKKK